MDRPLCGISENQERRIREWFQLYTKPYRRMQCDKGGIALKLAHIKRVEIESDALCNVLDWSESVTRLARVVALLHDIGRFEQIRRYQTFNDRKSVNHATLGVEVLEEAKILERIGKSNQDCVITAIRNHNRFDLEEGIAESILPFCRLIRDADKLDIFKVILAIDKNGSEFERAIIFHDLPESKTVSPEVIIAIENHRLIKIQDLKCRNDFRLMVMAWIFDLNFTASVKAVFKRKYMDQMAERLPEGHEVMGAMEILRNFIDNKTRP